MSPDLFNYDSELILRELDKERGLEWVDINITSIRNVDENELLVESVDDFQRLFDLVVRESDRKGLPINCKKTECLA